MATYGSLLRSAATQEVTGTQPGAGAEWSITVPAGQVWRLETLFYTLTASAVVANRFPNITITDGTNIIWRGAAGTTGLPAGSTWVVCAGRLVAPPGANAASSNAPQTIALPDVWLPAGYVIASLTPNKDVGDQYSTVRGLALVSTDL